MVPVGRPWLRARQVGDLGHMKTSRELWLDFGKWVLGALAAVGVAHELAQCHYQTARACYDSGGTHFSEMPDYCYHPDNSK